VTFGDAYLTQPLMDEMLAAQPWGSETLTIEVAGGPYRISGMAPTQATWVRGRYQDLCAAASGAARAAIPTTLYRLPEHAFRELDTRGWEYTFDRDYHPECLRLAGRDFVAEVQFAPELRGQVWTSRADSERFSYVIENFFRVLVAYQLTHCGGVLLHSAAFACEDRAHVVFGPSGAGKSTSAGIALEAGWEVLSDDMNALLPGPQGWRVEKLPFAGDLGQTPSRVGPYPLAGLHWLQQAATHAMQALPAAVALARLLACAPTINEDPYRLDDLLHNLTHLLTQVGAGSLDFARDAGFLPLLGSYR
jgi:hypothetical protein